MKIFSLMFLFLASVAFGDIGLVGSSFYQQLDGTAVAGSVEKYYINCKNTKGSSVPDGSIMILDSANDDGYSCTTGATAGLTPLCVMAKEDASACADDAVCRCQTYGLNEGVLFDVTNATASADESAYISESNAGYVEAERPANLSAFDKPIGVFYDEQTASADVQLFIKLR